jgi:hypothetical protein
MISSPSVLSHDTTTSKDNPHDFYPKNFNHAFLPKPDFEGFKNNYRKEFEENQNYVGDEKFHQEPDQDFLNGSKTMKMLSQNWLYLGKRLGMMMKSRSVALYRMLKISAWLIQFLKN